MFEHILMGFTAIFAPENLFWAFMGVFFGVVIGAIPGLSEHMVVVIFLPLTFYLDPIPGISMLVGLGKGANYGCAIPAILFNIPGSPQAMVTTFDGYPLAKQGLAGKGLHAALYSSVVADTVGSLVLMFLAAPVAALALLIGPPEYTGIIFFSLVIIAIASGKDLSRGLLAVSIGLLLCTVGVDAGTGSLRMTFGTLELAEGIPLMPMVIGLLAFSEVLRQAYDLYARQEGGLQDDVIPPVPRKQLLSLKECIDLLPVTLRSTGIGAVIGIIPGIGTTVGAYLSYVGAKKLSKNPERFGNGSLEGVAASEAGNSAVNSPSLVPLVTLGIPGNLAAALIMSAFMMKGLIPGPTFMETQAPMLYALFMVLLFSNFFLYVIGRLSLPFAPELRKIPVPWLIAFVFVFSVVGAYSARNSLFDIALMFAFGLLGLALNHLKISTPTTLIAFLLGSILETKVRQSLSLSGYDWSIFFTRPISCAFICLAVICIIARLWQLFIRSKTRDETIDPLSLE